MGLPKGPTGRLLACLLQTLCLTHIEGAEGLRPAGLHIGRALSEPPPRASLANGRQARSTCGRGYPSSFLGACKSTPAFILPHTLEPKRGPTGAIHQARGAVTTRPSRAILQAWVPGGRASSQI